MTKAKADGRSAEDRLRDVLQAGEVERPGPRPGQAGPKGPRTKLLYITPETPGYKLAQVLFEQVAARALSLAEASEEIGVSAGTLSHIRTGRRTADQLERDIIKRISDWLELPALAGLILAEQVTLKDFYSTTSELQAGIERALRFILSDGDWGVMVPRGVESWDDDAKLFVIWCYEQATKTKLLSGGVNYQDLLKQLERFREEHPASYPAPEQEG